MKKYTDSLSAETKRSLFDLFLFAAAMAVLWATNKYPPVFSGFSVSVAVVIIYCAVFGKLFHFRPAHVIYGIVFAGGISLFLPVMWFLQGPWETDPTLPDLPVGIYYALLTFLYLIAVTFVQTVCDPSVKENRTSLFTAAAVPAVYMTAAAVICSSEHYLYIQFLMETASLTVFLSVITGAVYACLYRKIPSPKAFGFLPVSLIAVMLLSFVILSYLTNGPAGRFMIPDTSWICYLCLAATAGLYAAFFRLAEKAVSLIREQKNN